MTLHEAIIIVLRQKGRPMSTQEIADELNKNGLYSKKDGSTITAFQIHGRTRNYDHLFHRDGSMVSLKSKNPLPTPFHPSAQITQSKSRPITQVIPSPTSSPSSVANVAQVAPSPTSSPRIVTHNLMNQKNYKPANSIKNKIPEKPGLYCIRVDNPDSLPKPFAQHLKTRNHNILYIGIATTSLRQRLGQELWAEGHGTFFRGLGAVLGYRPPKGSLLHKSNKNNYTFSQSDENAIIRWINAHLLVNWVEFEDDFENMESALLKAQLPLLNTAKNPAKLPELAALREECRIIANQI